MDAVLAADRLTGAPPRADAACAHCGDRLSAGANGRFCCAGCAAAYQIVSGLGLERFYERLNLDAAQRRLKPDEAAAADLTALVVAAKDGTNTLHLMVDGLHCAACVWLIESVLARDPAVLRGRVNLTTRRLTLGWSGAPGYANSLISRLSALGFRLVPFDPARIASADARAERDLLRCLAVAGFAAGNVMLLSVSVWSGAGEMGPATRDLLHWISALIALPALAYAGRPFFRSALAALRARRTNMDVPISIGITLTALISVFETLRSADAAYFDSAITLVFFLLIGRYLDLRARGRMRGAASHMLALGAGYARVVEADGRVVAKPPGAIALDARVLVAAGERIAVDGRIVEGQSAIDTSLVTGESMPTEAGPGSAVFAGTLNLAAPLTVRVTATGEATLLAELARLMEEAERGRTRYTALADRLARFYAPVIHLAAFGTILAWSALGAPFETALLYGVSVLIVTCPCALALAVPVVQVVASGRLMRRGILLKSANALERLARIDRVVLDKTGTLTLGAPALIRDGTWGADDLAEAAALARRSTHPLARALAAACPDGALADGVIEVPGRGLERITADAVTRLGSRGWTGSADDDRPSDPELWLARPGRAPIRFGFADTLREDAADTVAALKARGLGVSLVSGDRRAAVERAADATGIADWHAEIRPDGKRAFLDVLAGDGHRALMVGDGLNDAPALAAASVSMAPATGTDIAQTAADIVFQGSRLGAVIEAIDTARSADRIARGNLGFALAYNFAVVPLAMLGQLTPVIAAAAMSSSSLVVVLNAIRLGRRGAVG